MSTILSISRRIYQPLFILTMIMGFHLDIAAQCPQSLGCNDDIQISLDYECFAVISPELVLEDERDGCDYVVTILTANDVILDQTTYDLGGNPVHPVIDGSFIGTPYKASVSFVDNNGTTISCWGWFSVEDKLPPEITCIDDITLDCSADLSELYTSMGMVQYCSDSSPMDMDMDPSTITLMLNPDTGSGSNTAMPWELIDFIDIDVPLSGSGTGTIITDGGTYMFEPEPVNEDIYRGDISGVQATEDNISPKISLVIEDTPANQAAIAQGVCVEINTVSFFKYQEQDNCDPDVEVIINKDEVHQLDCTVGDFTARRDIEYYTRDHVGLSAELCAFSIFFEEKSIADMDFPGNVFYDCDDPLINNNGQLDLSPEVTGQPTIDGFPLLDEDNLCKINVTFSDDTFSLCGINTIKILRRWTALDWCEGEYAQAYQTIKVEDDEAPQIECPDDGLRFYANNNCEGDVIFRPFDEDDVTGLKSIFDCGTLSAQVQFLRADDFNPLLQEQEYTDAMEIADNIFRASNLQNGLNYIRYIIFDDCGNESICEFEIIVEDEDPPYAICDQFTVVSLADNGWGRLYAAAVDDGSFDECGGPVTLEIRRDSTVCAELDEYKKDDTIFGDYIQFCCQEAGETVPVTMRVTDQGGKSNTCIVSVIVQDKTGIKLEACPSQLVYNFECEDISEIDPMNTGMPIISGDCGNGILRFEDSGTINDICGNGTIVRRWFVDLPGDNTVELFSCQQEFNFNSDVILTENSFTWPADRDDATCQNYSTDLGDAVLYQGVPVNEAPVCAHLSYSFSDRVFEDVEGYCLKIIRTWTVIDFCVYHASNNPTEGIWSRTQVIKVADSEGPILTNCPADITLSAASNDCDQLINFQAPEAYDNCAMEFLHPSQLIYEIRQNGNLIKSGNGHIVNDTLQSGTYIISWSAEGICSSTSSCSHQVIIRDDKAPVPYCRSGISTSLMPPSWAHEDPYVEIWASDFDLGSFDNCDPFVELSFDSTDLNLDVIRFDCDDIGPNMVTLWVTDDMGNQDFCNTVINIQANNNICPDRAGMMIAGHIETEFSELIENMEVSLQTMIDESMSYDMTDRDGEFTFRNLGSFYDYQLKPMSNDDYLNGVSTLDLIMIQRHILGQQPLNSPYQRIAADVDGDSNISAVDLIELRKLILGIYEVLPNNDAWRFVDKSFEFVNADTPWPFKESIDIYDLHSDEMYNDFIAVKVGDVNNSVNLSGDSNINSRSREESFISHEVLELDANEYLIPFYLKESGDIFGMQLFLEYNKESIEITQLEAGRLPVAESDFTYFDGRLALVWYNDKAIASNAKDALFYLTIRTEDQLSAQNFKLQQGKPSELYDIDLNRKDLVLEKFENSFDNKLYQNVPNPFSGITTIDFELARDAHVRMNIYDTNGRLVKSFNGDYQKGLNSLVLPKNELNGNGIYYYQLETESFSATRKMILIE